MGNLQFEKHYSKLTAASNFVPIQTKIQKISILNNLTGYFLLLFFFFVHILTLNQWNPNFGVTCGRNAQGGDFQEGEGRRGEEPTMQTVR